MSIEPISKNYNIEQGATFKLNFIYKSNGNPVNLTGYSARMQARKTIGDSTPYLSLTNGNGITLGGVAGTIDIVISSTATAALTHLEGVYDLEIESAGGEVIRLLKGRLFLQPEVTR